MDQQERNMEREVWQRVRGCKEEIPKQDLRQMQREAMELAAIYRSLASRMTGRRQEKLMLLCRGERENAAALAGIAVLSRQGGEAMKLWQPEKDDPRRLLERCYHRTRRCILEYMARSGDGEFGVVYEKMAKKAGEHCLMIAQLLGGMG